MKITVFTSNQPRHLALVKQLSKLGASVHAVLECTTVFPGVVEDFYKKSAVMQRYFSEVIKAEQSLFGDVQFSPNGVRTLSIKAGDLNRLTREQLADALESDVYIVFGSSFIKGWLIDFLVERGAYNIHMGLSPYYRGSSCNFWAMYDGRPAFVGATIHMLSRGLDSGPMLFHAIPALRAENPFEFTMKAVAAAQHGLVERLQSGRLHDMQRVLQDPKQELRYSRNAEFNDEVALQFLERGYSLEEMDSQLENGPRPVLLEPYQW